MTTKLHLGCEQGQQPLSILVTGGQRGDSPQFIAVLADKAYTSQANRAYLRRRGIKATIPSEADQDANRRAKGSQGGRPPAFDPEIYKQQRRLCRCRPIPDLTSS